MKERKNIDEKKIAIEIKNDNLKALRQLYEANQKKIFYFALQYVKSKEEAKEYVQNSFLLLWENRKNIDVNKSITSYLYKIVSNQIYNSYTRKIIKSKYIDYTQNNSNFFEENTQQHIYYQDMKNIISKLQEKLPPQRKKIFELSREEGLTYDEIAKKLNISKSTVENSIYQALKYFKKHLGDDFFLKKV